MNWNPTYEAGMASGVMARIAVGVIATTLVATSALPAFAGKPDREWLGAGQKHEQTVSAEARGKGKKKKDKSVTRRFSSSEAIEIPDSSIEDGFGAADPYPSRSMVGGFKGAKITDVNLTLRGFSHEFTRDVDVLLVAPGGRNAVVLGENALSTFDGIDPNGEWQLFILDDVAGDVGILADGWELEITASAKSKSKGKTKR
jgi:hypothetical protein